MKKKFNANFMKQAIELSEIACIIKKTGGAFGAIVEKNNKIIGEGYNQVIAQNDPTWHAEIQALREAGKAIGSFDLKGTTLYASTQPCPMCLSAAYLANIDHIFYGATNDQALQFSPSRQQDFFKEICKKENQIITSTQVMETEALEIWKKFSEQV